MEYLLAGFIILLISIFVYFVSPRFSPIPYFPSNKKDIPLIVKSLKLKNNQTVYDLGAGGGAVIFAAARTAFERNLNTKFIAVEINPFLILYLKGAALFHPDRNNISVIYGDIFKMHYPDSKNLTFFTYISPWYMETVFENISRHISSFHFVSYFYALPEKLQLKPEKTVAGVHSIFEYKT